MKKIYIIAAAIVVLSSVATQQNAQARSMEEGGIGLDLYYGFPNLLTSGLKAAYVDNSVASTYLNVKVGGLGPVGGRFEYMLSDKFGMGLDFSYANSSVEWNENITGTDYSFKVSAPRWRALARFNFHMGESDVADPYFGLGVGYASWKFNYETNYTTFPAGSVRNLLPIGFRVAFGSRFYFTDFLGMNVEVGLGGPLLTGGLSFKF